MSETAKEPIKGPEAHERRHHLWFSLGLAGLSTLAFAQPVLDLLSRNPEFLVAHRFDSSDVLVFALGLGVLGPLCLGSLGVLLAHSISVLVARRAERRLALTRAICGGLAGLLAGFVALRLLKGLNSESLWPLALAFVPAIAWIVARHEAGRTMVHFMAPALIAAPALFLVGSGVRAATVEAPVGSFGQQAPQSAPVIFVLFDEWSIGSVLTVDGDLDRDRLPNLAEFADGATWFKNALTVAESTVRAVPALLSGRLPRGPVPTLSDYPNNLFTLVGGTYEVYADEPISRLCPSAINRVAQRSRRSRLGLAVADALVVWGHAVLPSSLTPDLPPISDRWTDFGDGARQPEFARPDGDTIKRRALGALADDRSDRFRAFIERIETSARSREGPQLHFIHSMLPHRPAEFLRDGTRYGRVRPLGLENGDWKDDPLLAAQVYERYEEQVEFVDRLLGELFEALERTGLLEEAAIVVTADHGVSFTAGASRRDYGVSTAHEVLPVPLFIKAPGQEVGVVDESYVKTVDVVPTLADHLGWQLPASAEPAWSFDGLSRARRATATDSAKRSDEGTLELMTKDDARTTAADVHRRKAETLAWKRRWIPEGSKRFVAEPRAELRGRSLASLPSRFERDLEIVVESYLPRRAQARPGSSRWVGGVVRGIADVSVQDMALAVDGTIARTTRADRLKDGSLGFGTLLPEAALPEGGHVEIFVLEQRGGRPMLVRPGSDLQEVEQLFDGTELTAVRVGDRTLPMGRVRGYVRHLEPLDEGFLVHGWAMVPGSKKPAEAVLVFDEGVLVGRLAGGEERPWVAENLGESARFSGFSRRFARTLASPTRGLQFIAISDDRAAELEALPVRYSARSNLLTFANGRVLEVRPPDESGLTGQLVQTQGASAIAGWAADLSTGRRARRIAVFEEGQFREQLAPSLNEGISENQPRRSGFRYLLSEDDRESLRAGRLQFVALSVDRAARLQPPGPSR